MERDDLLNEEKLPLSVLVVDDEPDYAEAVVNTLERINAECEVAHSGEITSSSCGNVQP